MLNETFSVVFKHYRDDEWGLFIVKLFFSPRFVAKQPQVQTRRKFKIPKGIVHPLVFTKAESIAGYEKFTLDEVIYPGKTEEKQVEVTSTI